MNRKPAIVIDNGYQSIKAGLSDEFEFSVWFPTLIGEPKSPDMIIGVDQKDFFVGNEIEGKWDLLNIHNPISAGEITNWSSMKKIWEYTFE